MLELWWIQSTPSLPLLQGSLKPGVGAADRVRSMGQIELNNVLMQNWIVWNRTVLDIETVLFIAIKMDLALDNLQELICHKTQTNNRIVFTFKLCTNSKLNCLKWNCFCLLNWNVWIKTVWLNWIAWNSNIFDN